MGMILGFALFVGAVAGLAVSIGLCIFAFILTKKASRRRVHVWRIFASVALVSVPALFCAVYFFPYDTGSPGSNYSILFKYYLIAGFAYAAIPGGAAILSFFAAVFCTACAVNQERQPDACPSACRPMQFLLPLFCLLLGLWLGSKLIIPGDVVSRKATSGNSDMEAGLILKTAEAFFKQGRYDASLLRYTAMIESGGLGAAKLCKAYVGRGLCHIRLGNNEAAVADFDRAIRLKPKSSEAYNGRGWAKVGLERYTAALADFDAAHEICPAYAMVFNNRGVTLKNLGQREKARENFLRAVELDYDREAKGYALLNLAWLEYQDGRLDPALSYAERAIAVLPEYAMGYNDRGAIREDMGQLEQAMADYAKSVELGKDSDSSSHSLINRGVRRIIDGDYAAAENDFAAVLHKNLPMKEEAAVWLFVAMKQRGAKTAEIDEKLAKLVKGADMVEWPSSALQLFRGEMQVDEFSASYWHKYPAERMFRKAAMFYYMGQHWLYQGQADKAMDCFRQCLKVEARDSNATRMAKTMLAVTIQD